MLHESVAQVNPSARPFLENKLFPAKSKGRVNPPASAAAGKGAPLKAKPRKSVLIAISRHGFTL
jgi:hypothetical protein